MLSNSKLSLRLHNKTTSLMANLSLFSQIVSKLDRNLFGKLVTKHQIDKHQKASRVGHI